MRRLLDSFLVGLSDTQLITGFALTLVTEFFTPCSISAYHYNIVCNLVIMSLIVHLCSMIVIEHYFKNIALGLLRIALILTTMSLGVILFFERSSGKFPLNPSTDSRSLVINGTLVANTTTLVIPAICFMANSTMPNSSEASKANFWWGFFEYIALFIFFLVSAGLSAYHTHFFKKDVKYSANPVIYWIRGGLLVAGLGISGWVIYNLFHLQHWMQDSGWFGEDDGESDGKTFGQIVPLVLLALPFLALFEAYAGMFSFSMVGPK